MSNNRPLTLIDILNLEKEIELLQDKIRIRLSETESRAKIIDTMGIDQNQLSKYKNKKRAFSMKRVFEMAKVLWK
jgi:hypothetical protein